MMKLCLQITVFLSCLIFESRLLAQSSLDTSQTKNYVQPFSPSSAFRTWSFSINAGILSPSTLYSKFDGSGDFTSPRNQVGYGGFIKKQVLSSLGIQANFLAGKYGGSDPQPDPLTAPYSKFNTQLKWSGALLANFTLANINWRYNKVFIQPYLNVGGGIVAYSPTVYAQNGTALSPGDYKAFFFPIGAGFKFDLTSGFNLDLGYQANFVNADNVDGYVYGGKNDRFSYGYIGLEFALGKGSKPQLLTHNPVSSMRYEYLLNQKTLQNQLNVQNTRFDQLRLDMEAINAKISASYDKLTQDSDGDGVSDWFDKCPNTPAGTRVDGAGCPLILPNEAEKKIFIDAFANLEFDLGKSTIREHSLLGLNKVADILIKGNFTLKIAGHTDNTGSAELNMRLSKNRAEAVKAYLVKKGANPSRIEATGYGLGQPISTNKTVSGRQQNRRVEFTFY